MACWDYSFEAILMSTHNIQFLAEKNIFLIIFPWVIGRTSQGIKNEFELAMENDPLMFELLRFDCSSLFYSTQWFYEQTMKVLKRRLIWPSLSAYARIPASILRKTTSGRHRPVSYPDGPMTARYRFTQNADWECLMNVVVFVEK